MIELPLSEPELFRRLGVEPPSGVLLYGPPGTGKTLIARAVANEVDAEFVTISGPEIMSKYKGESEEQLRETFEKAREEAPTIVFFDEIDSIAGTRDDDGDAENRIVGQLLTLMDGLDGRGEVIVIGATNRVDAIDPALRRGGRFDREIQIGVPDETGRREILEVHTRGMPLADDVDIDAIARRTHGFVGADLDAVASEAAMAAIRDRPTETDDRREWNRNPTVRKNHFDAALASVEPSAMREYVAESPTTDFSDVGGLDEAKQTLRESVEWPLTYDRLFEETNTDPPSGVLLYGPPGTGKTLLARALAGETDANFVRVDGPEIIDRYVGESEKAIREVFERARQSAPSIVFFDELDAIAAARGDGHEVTERVVSQLLTELDGMQENPNLVVLAATNRKDQIDPALLRPGRLDTHVFVGEPDLDAARRSSRSTRRANRSPTTSMSTNSRPNSRDTPARISRRWSETPRCGRFERWPRIQTPKRPMSGPTRSESSDDTSRSRGTRPTEREPNRSSSGRYSQPDCQCMVLASFGGREASSPAVPSTESSSPSRSVSLSSGNGITSPSRTATRTIPDSQPTNTLSRVPPSSTVTDRTVSSAARSTEHSPSPSFGGSDRVVSR